MRVVLTGGHHTPALAVVAELQKKGVHNLYWIGHRHSMWGDKEDSSEYKVVTKAGIPFFDLKAGKLYKTYHPIKLLRIPWGFIQALYYLLKINPDVVICFGGYLAAPVAFWSWVFGKLVVTHEQTVVAGLANRVVALFATKVFLSWEESETYFKENKTVVVGNPLRNAIFRVRADHPLLSPKLSGSRVLYITGGKQGSYTINSLIWPILPKLLSRYVVVHQTGSTTVVDSYQKALEIKEGLGPFKSARYFVYDYIDDRDIGAVFNRSDLVISRSGANTVYELAALGKPCLLIPIPWVSHNEQFRNAQVLERVGLARILDQRDLTSERLFDEINSMVEALSSLSQAKLLATRLVRREAAKALVGEVLRLAASRL